MLSDKEMPTHTSFRYVNFALQVILDWLIKMPQPGLARVKVLRLGVSGRDQEKEREEKGKVAVA